ncbi:MAG TPA: hypothetical protein VKH64_15510 [Candidatus Binatia bacterium]|nr:hypothetical protein [Candidatus Binatia bacterium]
MSYKAILLGILIFLAIPSAAAAQVIFQATFSGTEFCHSAVTKIKGTVFITFSAGGMLITKDPQLKDVISVMLINESFETSTTAGAFSFSDIDAGNFGIFTGTFKDNGDQVTGFTGNFGAIFSDGCFQTVTIKSGKIIAQ